jgi:hypothetical protein
VTISPGFRYPLRMWSTSRGHCRFTGHWFIRKVSPLFIASPNFTALNIGPYAPMTETVPPLRTESIAQFSATGEPPCNFSLLHQVAVGLGSRGVDGDIASQIIGDLLQMHHDVVVLGEVVGLGVREAARLLQPVV